MSECEWDVDESLCLGWMYGWMDGSVVFVLLVDS